MAIWLVDLTVEPEQRLVDRLSDVEQDRAARFLRSVPRRRYLAAHCALRQLVERHCHVPAAAQRYHRTDAGQWHCDGLSGWHLSLSYAGDVGLVGLGQHGAIGIDLETDRPIVNAAGLVRSYCSRAERLAFALLPRADRNAGFLRAWTRKEACAKALGRGLSIPLAELDCGIDGAHRTLCYSDRRIDVGSFRPAAGLVAAWAQLR
ncbi:4'-phosphopantetheinyl transferase family protein [Sphingomonas prati]|uniref:4'-phosphopantetheinyl transferase n=1 Tax=Sphingomonas prati TaxID=1843237 RepID=A0A7W9F1W8_9SPHN|nr:4'-phosphopantetheinyl transferase superfamily protein [Sphingomonas prati]MBB5729691.1 4'-phosphopantetheinyl transferase [Sphingomonas prati]